MSRSIVLSCLTVIGLAVLSPQLAVADGRLFPDTISLPNGFRPEGIAIGRGATIFAGSIPTGAIYAADLVTGRGSILVPAQPGRAAIGLSFDPRTNLLYVAGGPTGQAYVYDARTGDTVAVVQLTTQTATFINDQIVVDDAVYFTDSQRAVLYKLPLNRRGRPAAQPTATEIPLGGDWVQLPGFNANGIVATPGGRALIVVNSSAGALFRIDPNTGVARTIDLGGANVNNGDGMLLRGDDLFVVQNQLNQIAVIDLDRRFERGEVKQLITDTRFDVPTTIDDFLGVVYVVNARFSTPPTADTTYTIEKARRSR
jgi:outer membrane protein assembly factor BamB